MRDGHVDFFHAGFAGRDNRGIRFQLSADLLGPLLNSDLLPRLCRIANLPFISGPISVYPDISPKQFGFPAGVVLETDPGWLYPLSAPDMGCGYLVLDTGILMDPDSIRMQDLEAAFEEIVDAISISSLSRRRIYIPVEEIMIAGLASAGAPMHFSIGQSAAEESNSWEPTLDGLDASFVESSLQESLGSAAGHFIACYVTEQSFVPDTPPRGRVILVVHVGAAPIRDHMNESGLYSELAEKAIESGISSLEDVTDGLFAVDLSTSKGQALVGAAMAARNFGYVNRQLVADRVTEILRCRFRQYASAPATQIRHVDHVAFETVGERIRSRRGLQPLHRDRPVFITGGEHTHAYLCASGPNGWVGGDGLCCHGAPVRDTTDLPYHLWTDLGSGIDLGSASGWSRTMVANTALQARRYWSDVSSLETVVAYLWRSGIAHPTVRMRPLMNYRETNL